LVVASARVVVSEERRGKERERSWFWKKGAEVSSSSSSSSLQREREIQRSLRISSVLLFPENESVCGYSFLFGT
jgi:hypothetical protein